MKVSITETIRLRFPQNRMPPRKGPGVVRTGVDGGQDRGGRGLFKWNDAKFARCTRLGNAISLGDSPGTDGSHNQALLSFPPRSCPRRKILRHFRPVSSIDGGSSFPLAYEIHLRPVRGARNPPSGENAAEKKKIDLPWRSLMIPSAFFFLLSFSFVCGNNDDATLSSLLFHFVPTISMRSGEKLQKFP